MATGVDQAAKVKIESAISKLITFYPLFGTVFLYLNKRQTVQMPTMAVGITRRVDLALYYNPDFVKKLTHDEIKAVLIHEAMHVLLHHISRAGHYGYTMKGFNIAADMAINCSIQNLPEGALYPKSFGMPDHEAAEWYYRKLKDEAEKQGKSVNEMAGEKGGLVDDHSMWGECEDDIVKEKIRGIARKAIKEQEKEGWGNIPGDIIARVLAANRSVVNWKKELRYFINKLVAHGSRTTRSRLNRREQSSMIDRVPELQDIYLNPGKRKHYTSRILVGIDTPSGSVCDKELSEFVDELNGLISHVQCDYICFDTQMYGDPKPFTKKAKEVDIKGRGGTSFYPICEYIDEAQYDGLIIMTDGFAPMPPKPRARVMWCLTQSGAGQQPPYGKRVVIETKNNY